MTIRILYEQQAKTEVQRLINQSDGISFAVAWAGMNDISRTLNRNKRKVLQGVIGTHMYQTSPDALEMLTTNSRIFCLPPSGRLFHPKIYLFWSERNNNATMIIGSHNLTKSAFDSGNIEISVMIETSTDDHEFLNLREFISDHWENARHIDTDEFLREYSAAYRRKQNARNTLDQIIPTRTRNPPPINNPISPLLLSWDDYINGVKDNTELEGRLSVLDAAQNLLLKKDFRYMTPLEQKAIAGIYGRTEERLYNLGWGAFGSNFGHGDLKGIIRRQNHDRIGLLADALNAIPATGDVSKDNYQSFVDSYQQAFRGLPHGGRIKSASRFLSLKRPDLFLTVNSGNERKIREATGAPPINFDNYWNHIVLPLTECNWWNEEPETKLGARLWPYRAAMLDCLYYEED